jgi:phosphohistidine phosphatase
MKTLHLVRHAKSASHFSNSSDFAGTLNDRGVRDAIEMGKRLFEKKVPIDLFVSSPAERAKTTAELFIRQYQRDFKEIVYIQDLYHSIPETFESVVAALDDSKDHVAIFSHNPGITEYANGLSGEKINNMPTAGVFSVSADINSWTAFAAARKNFLMFDFPKSSEE